jgi:DNA repair protein RadC
MKHQFKIVWSNKNKSLPQATIKDSSDVAEYMYNFYDKRTIEYTETSYMLVLNQANDVIGVHKLSEGGLTGTIIDTRAVCIAALLLNAKAVILSHNHPSGNLKPSKADIDLTYKIKDALKLLEIDLLDHVIVSKDSYRSLYE